MSAVQTNFGMSRSESLNELAKALAKAQGLFKSAEREHFAKVTSKKGEGSSYSYNYADLASYLDVCREPLAQSGLSFVQSTSCNQGEVSVATVLLHESGQWIEFPPLTLHAENTMPQTIGSAITYARRYSLSAVLGMASEADDDANGAQGNQASTQRREPLPACPSCGKPDAVIVGKPEFGGGMVCFTKKGGCDHKWETPDHPFNENHKGKSNGKSGATNHVEELAEKSRVEKCLESLAGATTPARRETWRKQTLVRIKEGVFTLPEVGRLSEAGAAAAVNEDEADAIHKWLCEVAEELPDFDGDKAARTLTAKRATMGAA